MSLLEIRGLTKSFGGVRAIDDLDMSVEPGEVVSVIGPNGAGKTTLFNLITGFLGPDTGRIVLRATRRKRQRWWRRPTETDPGVGEEKEFDVVGLVPSQVLELGISRTFQNVRLFPQMTVRENVMVARHARTTSGLVGAIFRTRGFRREEAETKQRAEEALAFFGSRLVGYRFDSLAMSLSYANRRRLEIARAMASDPVLLLLDEPTAGMNPRETRELTELVGKLREEKGFAVVLIEHDMRVVKGVSDRVIVLDYGKKIAEGTYQEVVANERVIEAYLGTVAAG